MDQTASHRPLRRAVAIVAALNLGYFGIEFAVALGIGSVSLFADSIDFLEDASINLLILLALGFPARMRARVGMLLAAVQAAESLRADGISTRVLSMHTVKPLDADAIARAIHETRAVVSVEEHSVASGLGAAVAQVIATARAPRASFAMYGLPDRRYSRVGNHQHMRALLGDLRQTVLECLRGAA